MINMKKTTDELLKALNNTMHIDTYLKENSESMINADVSYYLNEKIKEKNITKSKVIKNSELNEIYGYQILSGKRKASRDKLICICIGAGFDLDETNEILKIALFSPLFPKLRRDSIIILGIQNQEPVWKINESLFDYKLETLS